MLRVAIFMPSYGDGGVERMLVNLAGGLVSLGVEVDFVTRVACAPYLERLDPAVGLVESGATGHLAVQPAARRYLVARRPDLVLCGKDAAARAVLLARRLSGVPFGLVMRPGTTLSARLAGRSAWHRWRVRRAVRATYGAAVAIVGNSRGVVDDVAALTRLPSDRLHLIHNPVISADLQVQANAPLDHRWFGSGEPPVVLGIGGLRRQKGFDTLVRAFACLRARRACRLVILGEGRLRGELLRLASGLGVADEVLLAGFDPNPYRYLARASLFVLSSRWEGSPNVLTEALAVGVPVVATDCRSGPAEVLDGGRVGPLVPVDDIEALADAMDRALDEPGDAAIRRAAVAHYTVEECARRYHALFERLLAARG
ncbi:glycosyltransferase [Rhodocyclaceae bacterium SMB388]